MGVVEEIDIWRSAQQVIKTFGADAAKHAETRAAHLSGEVAHTGAGVMLKVAAAVRALQKQPRANEQRN